MNDHLRAKAFDPRNAISVEVTGQQHELKEKHSGGPHGCGAAKKRQDHLADHRLKAEQQERAQQQSRREQESKIRRTIQHAA